MGTSFSGAGAAGAIGDSPAGTALSGAPRPTAPATAKSTAPTTAPVRERQG
ncbi:MAG: hypothetical protein QM699_00645 [Amaricoccus sp.]|uniref:hypothetical protein n=1 Tax=Amaricoccus sp. TaxID=1872485 RepID=UPI0039E45413